MFSRKSRFFAGVLLLWLSPEVGTSQVSTSICPYDRPRVLIVGDSHAQALGPLIQEYYEDYHYEAHWHSLPGKSTRHLIELVEGSSVPIDTAVVVVGGNNRDMDPLSYRESVDALLGALRHRSVHTIHWIGPLRSSVPGVDRRHRETSLLQSSILNNRLGLRWYDLYSHTSNTHYTYVDGVHLTFPSYRRMSISYLFPLLFR